MRFLAGKLRDFKQMLLTGLSWNQKKKELWRMRILGACIFLKFFGGKNNFLTVVIRGKTSRKKKNDI